MKILKFKGNIELEEVFNLHKSEIYDNLYQSIEKCYLDLSKTEANIIKISINEFDYTINLTRDKFINGLEGALTYYESIEEYEKCAKCLAIINNLKKISEEK
jgi:hypothetical protein